MADGWGEAGDGAAAGFASCGELAELDALLGRLRARPADDPVRELAERAVSAFVREGRKRRRAVRREEVRAADLRTAAATAAGSARRPEDEPLTAPGSAGRYVRPQRCYVCKEFFHRADALYHRLCPGCAADNTARRGLRTDLRGRRVLLTGGRVKIGFQLALMMLRDGAELLVTSRFPADTLRRFHAVPGSERWRDRLSVVGIDLRDPRQVIGLCDELLERGRPLDVLVNNAAQTIRRGPEAYALLTAAEPATLPAGARTAPGFEPRSAVALLPSVAAPGGGTAALPAGRPLAALPVRTGGPAAAPVRADAAGLVPDTARTNSWSVRLGELDAAEVLETQLVNAYAPALLCDRLLPLLLASPHERRYVINVTAVEGWFAARNKSDRHPHTNMAKAALNMLTRTSGPGLAGRGVHMCAVDTGWITDENPAHVKASSAAAGFRPPLDVVDGAARVYDPVVRGESGDPVSGVLLKDYAEVAW